MKQFSFSKIPFGYLAVFVIVFSCEAESETAQAFGLCLAKRGTQISSFIPRNSTSHLYTHLNHQWNTRKGIILPLGYVLPHSTRDIQNAITCGKELRIKVFGKGGGHSHEKHSFGDPYSVIIDLTPFSEIMVDDVTKTATVGAGVLMGRLVWSLWNNGSYAVPTTDCPNAGIAGATLGGGFGVWSKRWGMLSDNVIEFEMVDPNGNFLIANETTNTDLFWALRGAGAGNFGIVTKFKYRLIDVSQLKVTFIQLTYAFDQFPLVMEALLSWIQKTLHKPMHTYMSLEADDQVIVYLIDVAMTPDQIEMVKEAFPPNRTSLTVVESNFIEYVAAEAYPPKTVDELANVTRHEYPQYSTRVKTYFSNKILNSTELHLLNEVCSEIPEGVFLYIDAWGGVLNEIGRNATAFVHRNLLFMLHVSLRVDTVEGNEWMKRFDSVASDILNSKEGLQTLVDEELKDYLGKYYGENLNRLIDVKRKIDPDNYFSFAQSIPVVQLKIQG